MVNWGSLFAQIYSLKKRANSSSLKYCVQIKTWGVDWNVEVLQVKVVFIDRRSSELCGAGIDTDVPHGGGGADDACLEVTFLEGQGNSLSLTETAGAQRGARSGTRKLETRSPANQPGQGSWLAKKTGSRKLETSKKIRKVGNSKHGKTCLN